MAKQNTIHRPNIDYERFQVKRLDGDELRVKLGIQVDKNKDLEVRWVHRDVIVMVKKAQSEFDFHLVDIETWWVKKELYQE